MAASAARAASTAAANFASSVSSRSAGNPSAYTTSVPFTRAASSALVTALLLGLAVSWTKAEIINKALAELEAIMTSVVTRVIIPILPFFVGATFCELSYEGRLTVQFPIFLKVIGIVIVGHFIWLAVLYSIGGILSGRNPWRVLRYYLPAYLTAVGTMSSAATLPVALSCARRSPALSKTVTEFMIPLGATVHLCGSVLTETFFVMTISLMLYGTLPSVGTMAFFIVLFGIFAVAALRIMPSVRSIMGAWTSLRYNRYTIDVLRDARLYDTPAGIDTTQERMPFEREIRIEGLSFHFDDAPDRDILHDLSLTIRKGERIGIRGASGVGKTTLFNILLGFYRPTAGRITIDGRPLDETNLRKWQNTIGYVSQSVFIADSSFMQNVALGCAPDRIDRRRAAQALETAKLKEFIDTLPQGMETPIGECGCRLSGGQRQRLGIARALYKQADILFFDEATSALDNRTEERINRAIKELSKANRELTIIVVAHRESSLDYCDRIITLGEKTA